MSPDGRLLTLRGYLGIPLLGMDEVWHRVPDTLATLDHAVLAKYLPDGARGSSASTSQRPAQAPGARRQAPAPLGVRFGHAFIT